MNINVQSFMNKHVSVKARSGGVFNHILINDLRELSLYASTDPIVSRLVTFYQELVYKMPINISATIAQKGAEIELILELASQEFNRVWVPILKQCARDLLTFGFYILMFESTENESIDSYYSRFNAGFCTDMHAQMFSDNQFGKVEDLPNTNTDSYYRSGEISIFSKKPIRLDPCAVVLKWEPDWIKGVHSFEVKTEDGEILPAIVFYDPSCFVPGMTPRSCVKRVIPYADSLEQIRKSQVQLYTQMPHPLLVISNNADNRNLVPPMSTTVAERQINDVAILSRTASTMVANYSTSNELVSYAIRRSKEVDLEQMSVKSNVKSNLIFNDAIRNTLLNTDSVLGLPAGHSATQINQYTPLNINETMKELSSLIAMQFGVYPTFFTGDIKNTTNEGLRMLYQQISGTVNNMQTLMKGHMSVMIQHCFPEIRLQLAKTQFEYFNSRIEVAFSSSELATAQDILDFWNLGIISDESLVNKIRGMFDITEINPDFKPDLVSNNLIRLLEIQKMKAEIKNTLNPREETIEKDKETSQENTDEESNKEKKGEKRRSEEIDKEEEEEDEEKGRKKKKKKE